MHDPCRIHNDCSNYFSLFCFSVHNMGGWTIIPLLSRPETSRNPPEPPLIKKREEVIATCVSMCPSVHVVWHHQKNQTMAKAMKLCQMSGKEELGASHGKYYTFDLRPGFCWSVGLLAPKERNAYTMCLTEPYFKTNRPTWAQMRAALTQPRCCARKWQSHQLETNHDSCGTVL